MNTYIKLSIMAAFPVIVSVFIYYLEKNTSFRSLKYKTKQWIIGIVFGLVAICGTEFGVDIGGATMNVRDAAPLCAGLLFGAPSGIIAGLIGGIERYFAVYWGAGAYTQIACSVSTILSGVIAALFRKYMFDDKKPGCVYGLSIAVITEVFHMLAVFITNMSDVETAYSLVEKCTVPMVVLNGISVFLAVFIVAGLGRKKKSNENEIKKISQTFQKGLLICILVAFCVTTLFSWMLQTRLLINNSFEILKLNISDVNNDIRDASDENLLELTRTIAWEIERREYNTSEKLQELKNRYDVSEINIIDKNGIITETTYDAFFDYDMRSGEQSSEFMVLLDGETEEYVQKYQPISYDSSLYRKYAGKTLGDGGFVQVAYDSERFQKDIGIEVVGATRNRHVGERGYVIIADENKKIVSDSKGNEGKELSEAGIDIDNDIKEGEIFTQKIYGEASYGLYLKSEGYYCIAVLPVEEAVYLRDVSVYLTVFMQVLIFGALFVLVYVLVKIHIVDNIQKVNDSLAEITGGNLDVVINVRDNEEFASLSDDINSTVVTLKRYIAEAAARIDQELEFARAIQHSAMPSVFPPYPNRNEFSIYASMNAAKEVGGDFYDFYLIDDEHLAILIADVSGKGIPAAMFMMTAKTLLKSYAEAGCEVHEILTLTNEKLCENNDAEMFVTVWIGILNLKTGVMEFANAGHNPPFVRRKNSLYEALRTRPNFVLAGMEGVRYKKHELQLEPGDEIYIYTDGITEAVDVNNQLYGEERLADILNKNIGMDVETICKRVKDDVDGFAGEAPQFDDMTMLVLRFLGKGEK